MSTIAKGKGRPTEYRTADGTRVSGVTTILGRFKESGGLLQWAFQQGKAGAAHLYEQRDEAATAGHLVHAMVEASILGLPAPEIPDEFRQRCDSAYGAWSEWFHGSRFEIVATEVPLISELHRFGGTIDAIARDRHGRLCLLDWKTSNGVYTDYALQLAAYALLWNEHNPGEPITGGFHLARFAKEHGDFEHRHWPELEEGADMFLLLAQAYELDKKLRKRIK